MSRVKVTVLLEKSPTRKLRSLQLLIGRVIKDNENEILAYLFAESNEMTLKVDS